MVYFMENPKIKWMIWGYPSIPILDHFRKPPYLFLGCDAECAMVHLGFMGLNTVLTTEVYGVLPSTILW